MKRVPLLFRSFDTIDHVFLLSRLRVEFMIRRMICSYSSDILQLLNIKVMLSDRQELNFGVPQSSVLWPIFYCLYTKPVSNITHRFRPLHHSHADDTQLYIKKQDCFVEPL